MPVALAPLVRVAINLSYAGSAYSFGKPEAAALSPQGSSARRITIVKDSQP
jgi:hypothetical protein